MNGKINFGLDFITLLLYIDNLSNISSDKDEGNAIVVADALLVLEWGLSVEEELEVNKIFWKKYEEETLDDFRTVISRVVDNIENAPEAKSRLISNIGTITSLDNDLSDDEAKFIHDFGGALDFSPTEIYDLLGRGVDVLKIFNYIAENFEVTRR